MDRRLIFPAVAITAWAQQPSPADAEAEAALRARAEQFFQLQVDKKFRQAESLVAEDSKDAYYNAPKYNIKGFRIDKIVFSEGNTHAEVTIKAQVTLIIPGAPGIDMEAPKTTPWKLENGQWVYVVETPKVIQTPFGPLQTGGGKGPAPQLNSAGKTLDVSAIENMVKADRNSVELSSGTPAASVTITNSLPGDVDLELQPVTIKGLTVKLEKKHLRAGEKASLDLQKDDKGQGTGVVQVIVLPLSTEIDIQVRMN